MHLCGRKIEDIESGEIVYADLTSSNLEGQGDVLNGKYSAVSGNVKVDSGKKYKISVILQADGELYEVGR